MKKLQGLSMNIIIIIVLGVLILGGGIAWWLLADSNENSNQNTNTTDIVNSNISRINENTNIISAENINTQVGTNEATNTVNVNINPINTNNETVSDPTSDWLTYTNDWYNYQFMYPPDWTVEEVDISAEDSVGGWPNRYVKFIAPGGEYITYFGVRLVGEEISAFWRSGIGAGDISNEGSTMLGETSIPITYITYDGILQDIFYLNTGLVPNEINGHEVYGAFAGPDGTAYNEDEEFTTSNLILSTFMWLEGEEVSAAYENTDCGYSITLPTGWYAHEQSTSTTLFLMQETLPSIGATEGYAYGTQFSIRCGNIFTDAGANNETEFLEAMIDDTDIDGNPIPQSTVTRNGLSMTQYIMPAAGAEGNVLGYYYVNGTTYFGFSHWSYNELSTETADFETALETFTQI